MDFLISDKNLLQRGGKETFHPTMQEKFRISFPREISSPENRIAHYGIRGPQHNGRLPHNHPKGKPIPNSTFTQGSSKPFCPMLLN